MLRVLRCVSCLFVLCSTALASYDITFSGASGVAGGPDVMGSVMIKSTDGSTYQLQQARIGLTVQSAGGIGFSSAAFGTIWGGDGTNLSTASQVVAGDLSVLVDGEIANQASGADFDVTGVYQELYKLTFDVSAASPGTYDVVLITDGDAASGVSGPDGMDLLASGPGAKIGEIVLSAIPEPSAIALVGLCFAGVGISRFVRRGKEDEPTEDVA